MYTIKRNSIKKKWVVLLTIFLLIHHHKQGMTFLPDTTNSFDYPYVDDISTTTEAYKYIMYAYSMGTTSYTDQRRGINYEPIQMCFQGNKAVAVNPATYVTNAIATYPSLDLSPTSMPKLYDSFCFSGSNKGLYLPFFFHVDSTSPTFHLNLKLVNINNKSVGFVLKLEDFTTPTSNIITLNASNVMVPANSIYNYKFSFSVNSGQLNYNLQETGSTSYQTPVGSVYFRNSGTFGANPSFPTQTPSLQLYIDDTTGLADLGVAAIIIQTGKKN
jgi:hypothetical protein